MDTAYSHKSFCLNIIMKLEIKYKEKNSKKQKLLVAKQYATKKTNRSFKKSKRKLKDT